MVKQTIQIFARVKPTKARIGGYEIDETDDGLPLLSFNVPREAAGGYINNKKENFKFTFKRIFDQKAKQEEIFQNVAQPVIDNVLTGYNGTIFAYGQTGSGKTFTITGGAERYADRGIIPRTLSYIFEYYQKNKDFVYTTHISYLEIYNEAGYDLLDPKHEASKLEDLPKVSLMEDSDQNIHLKNLSTHQASNEEDALNLLFLGDTNRMIAETPMNQASTRSHCIFTIHVTAREAGSATQRRAKLHLVDLAGSERVSKTGVNGTLLGEAKYINLSLHYLEVVIVSLGEKNRQHVPYRNSMMTSVLRDSLGGNCMTTMIATCSAEKKNIDESISTCRFAQRVALIKNDALLNEELDPKLMIIKLKQQIQQLKEELAMATGEQRTDDLSAEEIEGCKEAVRIYLEDTDPECVLDVGADMRKIQQCYRIMKKLIEEGGGGTHRGDISQRGEVTPRAPESYIVTSETSKLKEMIQQRDNEINILVNMLKKEKKRAADAISQLSSAGHSIPRSISDTNMTNGVQSGRNEKPIKRPSSRGGRDSIQHDKKSRELEDKFKHKVLGDLSIGRQEAFEIFRRDYSESKAIEENKLILKQRYSQAKSLGEKVNKARTEINKVKSAIEQHRMTLVMQGLVDPDNPEPDETEQQLREQIEMEKANYKEAFGSLRTLKTEIEHLQHYLEKSKVQLMKDFEMWWAEQAANVQQHQNPTEKRPPSHGKSAWRTPPITPQHNQDPPHIHKQSTYVKNENLNSTGKSYSSKDRDSSGYSSSKDNSFNSSRSNRSNSQQLHRANSQAETGVQLTGDAQADADIMAFLKARQNIIKASSKGQR